MTHDDNGVIFDESGAMQRGGTPSAPRTGSTMGFDEARAKLIALTGLKSQDVDDFLAASPEDRDALVQGYADALKISDRSAWDTFLADLSIASGIAKDLLPIAGLASALMVL